MPFITGDREAPFQARLARNLVIVEGGLLIMGVALPAAITLLNPGTKIEASTAQLVLIGLAGVALVFLGVQVGRLVPWSRWVALGVQVPWCGFYLVNGEPVSIAIAVAFAGGTALCLTLNNIGAAYAEGLEAQPPATRWVPPEPGASTSGTDAEAGTAAAGGEQKSAGLDAETGSDAGAASQGTAENSATVSDTVP
jgi:hypothetical protein